MHSPQSNTGYTDDSTTAKIRAVVEKEIDIEIELRNKELALIEKRLTETMELLKTIQSFIPLKEEENGNGMDVNKPLLYHNHNTKQQ